MWAPSPDYAQPKDGLYISSSMTPTSHFEGETENVLQLYKQITGKDIDLVNLPEDADE
jgi:Rab GDP dissociation inhibitor